MRNTRKILVALMLVLTILVGMTVVASAATSTRVYVKNDAGWATVNCYYWNDSGNNSWPGKAMTLDSESGLYYYDIPSGYTMCIFNNGSAQTSDLVVPTSDYVVFNNSTNTWFDLDGNENVVVPTFTVAGDNSALFGTSWDVSNKANDMTYADGVYTKVYEKVSAGTYKFKCAQDHAWTVAYPSSDKSFTVATSGSTVTITLDAESHAVNVVVEPPKDDPTHTHSWADATCSEPQKCECGQTQGEALGHTFNAEGVCTVCNSAPIYTVAGDLTALFGTQWDAGNTANQMSYNVESGLWTISYTNSTDASVWPNLKVCYNKGWEKCWGGAAAGQSDDNAWVEIPAGHTLTIAFNDKTEKITFATEAPCAHEYMNACDAHCMLCGELTNPDAAHSLIHVDAVAPTCTASGVPEYWGCEICGSCWLDEALTQVTNRMSLYTPELGHTFAEGVCSVCGEADPDYVAPVVNDKLINFSTWEPFAKETYADGDILKLNDIFTFIMSKNSRVDESSKTWDDFSGTLRFSFGGKTPTGSVPAKNALQITVDGAHTLKIWYVAGGDGRYFALMDSTGAVLSETTKETVKNGQGYAELEIPAAGVYYFGVPGDNNYIFQLELVKKEEAPHVNTLVVGDTNKIVVSGEYVNDYNLPVEWVSFVAEDNGYYSFVGDNGALAFIFDANGGLVSATGAANLEAGAYLICLGNGVVGEFNVAVTKSAWVNALVEGANKIYVDDSLPNSANYYVAVVPFVVTEAGHYAFTSTNAIALIYDEAVNNLCGLTGAADLEAGTYYIWISAYTELTTGLFDVTLTKTAIGGGEIEEPELPKLQLGDNTVTIDGTTTNLLGNAIAWLELVVEEAGTYAVTSADLNCYIYSEMNLASAEACLCNFTGVAVLEPGTYYVCVGKEGATGEFTVNVDNGNVEIPVSNTIVVGDNVYVLSEKLKATGYEFIYITIEESGTYVFSGCAPLCFYIWPDYVDKYITEIPTDAPYVWNVDNLTYELTDSFEVYLEAGTHCVGFRYDEEGAVVGEYEYNVSLKVEEPVEELNFFEQIWQAILNFFAQIGEWFKNLFGGNK